MGRVLEYRKCAEDEEKKNCLLFLVITEAVGVAVVKKY